MGRPYYASGNCGDEIYKGDLSLYKDLFNYIKKKYVIGKQLTDDQIFELSYRDDNDVSRNDYFDAISSFCRVLIKGEHKYNMKYIGDGWKYYI